MKTFKVAVTGGRDHRITEAEEDAFWEILRYKEPKGLDPEGDAFFTVVLHGNCRGVDQQAAELASRWGFPVVPFEAPWSQLSGAAAAAYAGPLRNWIMLRAADLLVAFPGGDRTADCVRQARSLGVEVVEVGR